MCIAKLFIMKLIPLLNLKAKLRDFGSGFSDVIGVAVQIAIPGGGSAS